MTRPIRIRFYGRLRDAAGGAERNAVIPDDIQTAEDLVAWLSAGDPALGEALAHPSVKAAAGDVIIGRAADIRSASDVSFLPPFSGG